MKINLSAITQPVVESSAGVRMTADEFLVYCARVSSPQNQLNVGTSERLLAYCIRNNHWSIFEQVSMTLEIVTSRAISAQIIRHRSFAFQEFSQRYAPVTAFEPVELRKKGATNRQSSLEVFDPPVTPPDKCVALPASDWVREFLVEAEMLYNALLEAEVAPECARMILPLCAQTTIYMTGSVRSWIHYLKQRTDEHAQKEHRLLAEEAKRIFTHNFPITAGALAFV